MGIERLRIEDLRLDFQPSVCLLEETVQEITHRLLNGEPISPIVVRFDGGSYFVQDGFHRLEAARRCGMVEIDAEVLRGGLEEMEAEFQKMLDELKRDLRQSKSSI